AADSVAVVADGGDEAAGLVLPVAEGVCDVVQDALFVAHAAGADVLGRNAGWVAFAGFVGWLLDDAGGAGVAAVGAGPGAVLVGEGPDVVVLGHRGCSWWVRACAWMSVGSSRTTATRWMVAVTGTRSPQSGQGQVV